MPLEASIALASHVQTHSDTRLYDATSIDFLNWPETPNGVYAKKFLLPLVKNGIKHYIGNIHADIHALKINDIVLPIVVNHDNYDNSYVCSPYGHYFSYGDEHIDLIDNRFLRALVKPALSTFSVICRKQRFNSVVYVNSWLFAVDLFPSTLETDQIQQIVDLLTEKYPGYAIIFRSLNDIIHSNLQDNFEKSGFHLIASRYVRVTNPMEESLFKTRIIKSDLKLWRETSYTIRDETQLNLEECQNLLELYQHLYLKQHSNLHPHYNLNFMKLLLSEGLLHFKVIKDDSSIKGVVGYFARDGVMYCPIIGFDKNDPDHSVIYRLLNTALLLTAKERGWTFHQGAGASFFKSIRRAQGCFEYMAVYTKHLPFRQKISWSALKAFINGFAKPYMQKY